MVEINNSTVGNNRIGEKLSSKIINVQDLIRKIQGEILPKINKRTCTIIRDLRVISDILEIFDNLKINGFLIILDIEKAFDSVNHLFLITALENYGFKEDFIKWIQILIQNQKSCVINGGAAANYFKLERGTRQGDPISAYLLNCIFIDHAK